MYGCTNPGGPLPFVADKVSPQLHTASRLSTYKSSIQAYPHHPAKTVFPSLLACKAFPAAGPPMRSAKYSSLAKHKRLSKCGIK